jgi:hypothetical protein
MPLAEFAARVGRVGLLWVAAEQTALAAIGARVRTRVREKIGELQPAQGPFPAWAPLAPSTVRRKGHDRPLIETGAFREDVSYRVGVGRVEIGTHQDYIVYTELGTSTIPPRPVFGPAALDEIGWIQERVGQAWIEPFARVFSP